MNPPLTPVVRILLIACIGVFALQWLNAPLLEAHLAMWAPETGRFRVWQVVTANFLHADWIHLLVNCMVLYSFGPPMEKLLGARKFCVFYLVSAIGGSLLQLLAQHLGLSHAYYSLGASTGTSGLVLGFAMAFPRHKMMIFPIPVPLAAWICVAGFAAISLVLAFTGYLPGIGHFAHLGGMLGGLAMIFYWRARSVTR